MNINEIEGKVGSGEMTAAQCFTKMLEHLNNYDETLDKIEILEHRERTCATTDMAEKVALVKAIQLIGRAVGMTDENSPREIVERVKLLSENLKLDRVETESRS